MSDHLPECPCTNTSAHPDGCLCCEVSSPCICPLLRACEQRSYALGIEVGKHDAWIAGHAAGVAAARDAVAALPHEDGCCSKGCACQTWEKQGPCDLSCNCSFWWMPHALAAIDALKENT